MICPKCNEEILDNSNICSKCGEVLSKTITRNDNIITIRPSRKRKNKLENVEVLDSPELDKIEEKSNKLEEVQQINFTPDDIVIDSSYLENTNIEQNNNKKTIENIENLELDTSNIDNNLEISETNEEVEILDENEVELEVEKVKSKKKRKIKILLMLLGIICLSLLGLSIGLIISNKLEEEETTTDMITNTTFFISDDNGKYAVFDDNGNKITDFIYTDYNEYQNGSAIVYQDKKVGVINESGKEIIQLGKYKGIEEIAGLYKVYSKDYDYSLVDAHDNLLFKLDDYDIKTFSGINNVSILKDKKKKKYSVLNNQGKSILNFDSIEEEPMANSNNDILSIFYNNKNYIINIKDNKKIIDFEADKQYCINENTTDNIVILNTCSLDEKEYQIYKDNKLNNIGNICNNLVIDNNNIVCENKDGRFLLNDNYEIGNKVSAKMYINNSDYAQNKNNSTVEIIKDDKSVKTINCRQIVTSGYAYNELYLMNIKTYGSCPKDEFSYEFYNKEGEKSFEGKYKLAKPYDQNKLAIVSEDGKKYYLIDNTGKKISDDYDIIMYTDMGYLVLNDNKKGILDKTGKTIAECNYDKIDIFNQKYAVAENEYKKYFVYDLNNKKELIKVDYKPTITTHYIEVDGEDKNEYYTFDGKLFYENDKTGS